MSRRARLLLGIGLAAIAILAAGLILYVRAMTPKLELGVGYAARVACGCRYIAGRPIASCYHDFEPGMEPIRLHDDPAAKAVTAYVPLIANRTVRYDAVLGCQPDRFTGPRQDARW